MPRRDDLESILILGSGPIIIGQACEFDYSGTQAVRALKEEGYRVILVNSNPATIMTDPDLADRTYIEPLTADWVERVIEREKPDAILPTMGGQTALNIAMDLHRSGALEKHGVELIGANQRSIQMAEDREDFTEAMHRIGLEVPHGGFAETLDEALEIVEDTAYPAIIRPSFTMGGTGGGIAYNREEFERAVKKGLDASPVTRVLIDRSVMGWKEYELEVVRDGSDNVIIICSIENFDPMGVHTGDSITVAPAQTLSDVEYQRMRDAAIRIIREIGVEAGGCNIQFAVNPDNGEMLVVEMNPRVSRSSALASKATGFPIARVGAKLAVGYHLHELPNDITRTTPASFEPVLDYVVVKIPRFAFEKFPEARDTLGVQMQAVGEVMAIGRTFRSAWQKGFRGLEEGRSGWVVGPRLKDDGLEADDADSLLAAMRRPTPKRPFQLKRAMEAGIPQEEIFEATKIDPWFLDQLRQILEWEERYRTADEPGADLTRRMKREGFSDTQLARLRGETEAQVRERRWGWGIRPSYNVVDTCAGEFPAETPYFYSSYENETESEPSDREKVVILGSGPNRIGQGIEFDYCCVQAVLALREAGYETIMINSNPETVSTDFDVSDKLYFEPLTLEDVLEVLHLERPKGVIVQLGGQTPLKLAEGLEALGAPVLGTSVDAIDRAEDRDRFDEVCRAIGARTPDNGMATSVDEALEVARRIGFPVLVRPSYVLGGRAMRIVYDEDALHRYFAEAVEASEDHPVLVDSFLEDAFEADVDALSDGEDVVVGGIMQHIEDAGVHSGDSACVLPPYLLRGAVLDEMKELTRKFALELGVVGLINVQYAIRDGVVYVLEVNPRASRTIPFVSKATGVPLARLAARVMAGEKLADLDVPSDLRVPGVAVKEAAFPFNRFDVDTLLGPEMRSTGEVMGFDDSFGMAFAKAQVSAGNVLPEDSGTIIVTVNDSDKDTVTPILRRFVDMGFDILATKGTQEHLNRLGVPAERVYKVNEGRPNIVDHIVTGDVRLLINTPLGKKSQYDDYAMRRAAILYNTPYLTTMSATSAACDAILALKARSHSVKSLQERIESLAVASPGVSGDGTLPTGFFLHPASPLHDTGWDHPEHQGRLRALASSVGKDLLTLHGHVVQEEAADATLEDLLRVHDRELVRRVRDLCARSDVQQKILALDPDTKVSPATWDAAVGSAGTAIQACRRVVEGALSGAFVATRPPGHHATPHHAMGFCLFNNVAVAARWLQAEGHAGNVLIVDWDVHHGNGTQDAFYEDPSVFFLSLHQSPHYPGTGAAEETGRGAGEGATLNVPLPAGISRSAYRDRFHQALDLAFARFAPDFVLVSSGFDSMAGDPLGSFPLEGLDLYEMTREVVERAQEACGGRVVALLEGGYVPARVGEGTVAVIRGLAGLDAPVVPGGPPPS